MDDTTLYKICLVFSVAGIVLLFAFTVLLGPEKVELSSIDESYVGDRITTEGYVNDVRHSEDGHLFFHVKGGSGDIKIAVFSDNMREMGLKKGTIVNGDRVRVTGDVKRWKGEIEIIPTSIRLMV